jgi:hypothetical protein
MTTPANANTPGMNTVAAALAAPSTMYSPEIENNLNDYIAKISQEEDEANAKAVLEKPDAVEEGEEETVEEVKEGEQKPEEVEHDTQDEGLKRLMAREEAVRKMEADFEAKVAAAVKAKTPNFKGKDPEDVLKEVGFDPELVLKEMMYKRASDNNPVKAKLKEELRDWHTKKELDSMRLELEKRDAIAEQARYFQTVSSEARKHVESVDEKVAPVFSKLAKAKTDYAHQRVMQEIVKDAQERLARGEDGEPLSYSDAVSRVEKDLAVLAEVLASKADTTQGKKSAVVNPAMKTTKPLVKPVKEPTSDELIQMGIDKALKTFYVEEEKAKSGKR